MTTSAVADTELDELCVNTIRTLSMDGVQKANSGHPGTPMALAPITYVLYTRVMRHNPADPSGSTATASCSRRATRRCCSTRCSTSPGYGLELDDLKNFRQLGSPTAGPPRARRRRRHRGHHRPAGPGHLACRVGLALAERMLAARFNRRTTSRRPLHVHDRQRRRHAGGRLRRGVLAGRPPRARPADRLLRRQPHLDRGRHRASFTEDVGKRYEAYGWHVLNLGEDLDARRASSSAIEEAKAVEDRPSLIIVRTHIAPGSPNKQDTHKAHGAPLGEEEVRLTKKAYGWPSRGALLRARRVPGALPRGDRARQAGRRPSGRSGSSASRRGAGALRRLRAMIRRAGCRTAGTPTCRASRPTEGCSPRARRLTR